MYRYRGFDIIKDHNLWFSSADFTKWTDLAETLKGAKNAIDDYYDGVWNDFGEDCKKKIKIKGN